MVIRKRFGQHFLTDESVLEQIMLSADINQDDQILEIGPGKGALTNKLLATKAQVIAVEIDRDLASFLQSKFNGQTNFHLIVQDILNCNWDDILGGIGNKIKLVANLPYNISTPLLFKLIEYRNYFKSITIMLQKEVAQRICYHNQSKKDYGVLSVASQLIFHTQWICDVPAESFSPPPKVESAVIHLTPQKIIIPDEKIFFKFIQQLFQQRRKILLTQIKKKFPEIFHKLDSQQKDFFISLRPEDLTPKDFLDLFANHDIKS